MVSNTVLSNNPVLFDGIEYNILAAVAIILISYGFLLTTSGRVVAFTFKHAKVNLDDDDEESTEEDTGRAIGKIENVLVLSLMLLEAYTALGVIFAAKSLVRKSDMDAGDTSYYLTGTLANFTYSVGVGLLSHIILWAFIEFTLVEYLLGSV